MEYKRLIIDLLHQIDDADGKFLRQLYIIIKAHLKRRSK